MEEEPVVRWYARVSYGQPQLFKLTGRFTAKLFRIASKEKIEGFDWSYVGSQLSAKDIGLFESKGQALAHLIRRGEESLESAKERVVQSEKDLASIKEIAAIAAAKGGV